MKTEDEQLDPTINPAKGVKRLNKLPMISFIALTAFAALVIMFGILSKNKKAPGEEEEKGVSMDDASVDLMTAQIPEGDIQPTSSVRYRDASGAPSVSMAGDDSELAALAARLEALEGSYAAQAEELREAKEAEKLAVANAPLVVDIEAFRSRYPSASSGAPGSSDTGARAYRDSEDIKAHSSGGEDPETQRIGQGKLSIPMESPLLLPSRNDIEGAGSAGGEDLNLALGDGLEELSAEDLQAANGAENTYRKRAKDGTVVLPFQVQEPVSDLELKAGSTIPITMISGINSDLPGDIVAQVNTNIFDTRLGDYLLMPMGTRLIGSYESENVLGVDRVGVVWNRLIFPNGESLTIEAMRGSDTEGYSGLKDRVNNHYVRIFGSALMLSAVSTSIAIAGDDNQNSTAGINQSPDAQQTAANEISLNLGRVITEKLKADINIEPTIEIRPGMKSIVLVTKDLTFEKPYEQHLDYEKLGFPDLDPEPTYYDPRKGESVNIQPNK